MWIERISTSSDAQNKCAVYSAADLARIWEAFSACQLFNNDGASPMDGYRLQLDACINKNRVRYREVAKLALKQVFPDDTLLKSTLLSAMSSQALKRTRSRCARMLGLNTSVYYGRFAGARCDLQSQIDATGQRRIDPYVLFACNLNNPSREGRYVNALKACMKL